MPDSNWLGRHLGEQSDAAATSDTGTFSLLALTKRLLTRFGTGTSAVQTQGTAADGAAVVGNPVRVGGKDGSGNTQDILTDTDGNLQVDILTIAAGNTNIGDVDVASIAAGDNNIGNVDIVSGPTGASAVQFQGTAADGAAAVGNPVQVGGVDGSGNAQALLIDTNGRIQTGLYGSSGSQVTVRSPSADGIGGGTPNGLDGLSYPMLFNGTTWDRQRNNHEVTALASAARTASADSGDLVNYNARGAVIVVDVTALTGTPSLTFTIQGKSSLGSDYYTILASAAITATGVTVLRVYPGLTAAANSVANDILPRIWRVNVTNTNADSITYSVSANYVV